MNIAYLTSDYPLPGTLYGGIGTYLWNISQELANRGHNVYVILVDGPEDTETKVGNVTVISQKIKAPKWMEKRIVRHRLPIKELYTCFKATQILNKTVKRFKIDLIEASSYRNLHLFYSFKKIRPVIITRIYTTFKQAIRYEVRGFGFKLKQLFFLENLTLKKSDFLLTHSEGHRSEMASEINISTDRIRVIPLALPSKQPAIKTTFRQQSMNKTNFFFIGRFEKRKGIDLVLEAIPKVLEKNRNVEFVLAGKDFNRRYETQFWDAHGGRYKENVNFAGEIDNETRDKLYETCDVFLAPSRYESFGLIYLEAMQVGKPVIGGRVASIAEIIEDGQTGYLVSTSHSDELVERILALCADPNLRHEMGSKGYQRYREAFSFEKLLEDSLSFYSEVSGADKENTKTVIDSDTALSVL